MAEVKKSEDISTMFPQLHPANLKELKSAIRHFTGPGRIAGEDGVYIHGDGNIYPKKGDSDDRLNYRNDHVVNFGGGYRMQFRSTDAIPANIKDLEAALIAAMRVEGENSAKEEVRTSSNPLAVPDYTDEEGAAEETTEETTEEGIGGEGTPEAKKPKASKK